MAEQICDISNPLLFNKINNYYNKLLKTEKRKDYIVEAVNPAGRSSVHPINGQYKSFPTTNRFVISKINNISMLLMFLCDVGFAGKDFANRQDLFYYMGKLIRVYYNYRRNDGTLEFGDVFHIYDDEEQAIEDMKHQFIINTIHIKNADSLSKVAMRNICNFLKISKEEADYYYEVCNPKKGQ